MHSTSLFTSRSIALKICFTVIYAVMYLSGFAQKGLLEKANAFYNEERYGEAIPLYDKLYQQKKDRSVLLKLADANYLNENYPQAQKYYAEYFNDSVYEHIPQFGYYARSSRLCGKIDLAVRLYQKLYDITQADSSKSILEIYKLYVDSSQFVRSYDLDSNYKCITIDASGSVDTLAQPIFYRWVFDDGKTGEGLIVEHCFTTEGWHSVTLNTIDKKTGIVKQRDTSLVVFIDGPAVRFKVPEEGKRYFYLDFDAGATNLQGYEIIDYLWDMGNGEMESGKTIKHKYNNSGDYQIRLVVIARDMSTGSYKLFSSNKRFTVEENYGVPSKTFTDFLNEVK